MSTSENAKTALKLFRFNMIVLLLRLTLICRSGLKIGHQYDGEFAKVVDVMTCEQMHSATSIWFGTREEGKIRMMAAIRNAGHHH